MKKIFKSLMMIAATGLALTGCVKEDTVGVATTGKTIKATAWSPETRVVVESSDDSSVSLNWADGDKLDIHAFTGTTYNSSVEASDYVYDAKNVSFSFEEVADADTYYASHPAGAVSVNTQYKEFIVNIPAEQTPTQEFVDPSAVLLFSEAVKHSGEENANFTLNHAAAYAKMLVKSNEPIQSVTVTSLTTTNTNNRYGIAGQYWVYYAGDKVGNKEPGTNANVSTSIDITAPAEGFAKEGDYYAVWFTLIPQELTSFSVNVKTASGELTKKVTVDGDPLTFTEGKAKSFSVDMTKDTQVVEPLDGDYVILAKHSDGTYYAASGELSNNILPTKVFNDFTGKEQEVSVYDNTLIWHIECTGSNKYKLSYNGQAIGWNSTNSTANNAAFGDYSVLITDGEDDGTYNIQDAITNSRILAFNYNSGNPRFVFYNSSQNKNLYLVPATFKQLPVITFGSDNLQFKSDSSTGECDVTIEYTTETPEVKASNDDKGDSDCDWITDVKYNDNKITFNVSENTSSETGRTAYIVVKVNNDNGTVTNAIPVIQSKKTSGQPETIRINKDNIDGLASGSYNGDPLTWTINDIAFTGNRIMISNTTPYSSNNSLQLQSNANTYLGNTVSLGKITKIVVSSFNTSYVPNFTIDCGSESLASGNSATTYKADDCSTKGETIGKANNNDVYRYTSTFDLSSNNYEYFTLRKATSGALYIEYIEITYIP